MRLDNACPTNGLAMDPAVRPALDNPYSPPRCALTLAESDPILTATLVSASGAYSEIPPVSLLCNYIEEESDRKAFVESMASVTVKKEEVIMRQGTQTCRPSSVQPYFTGRAFGRTEPPPAPGRKAAASSSFSTHECTSPPSSPRTCRR